MSGSAKLAIAMAVFVGVATTLANDPTITVLIGVASMPVVMYAVSQLPLRHTMQGLLFLALALPNHAEGFPWKDWIAPFSYFGALLLTHWNSIDRSSGWVSPVVFSGMDMIFVVLGLVVYQRRQRRAKVDYAGALPAPMQMKKLARVALMTVAFTWVVGFLRGGNFGMSLWQINNVIYLPIVFLLFSEAIRGPQDFPPLLKAVCAAAVYRSLFAVYVINTKFVGPNNDEKLPYATAHADSILFGLATVALLILVLERVVKPFNWRIGVLLAVLFLGMVSNNRRLVWAHIGLCAAMTYFLVPDSAVKRWLRKWTFRAIPFAVLYVMAGWNSMYGNTYKPVRILRSMVETTSDASGSSYWREIENWNLVNTALSSPIFGRGFGNKYEEYIYMPPVDYSLEFYCPHNSFLGMFAYGGYVGFVGLTMWWATGVFYAMRAYRNSKDRTLRAASLISINGLLIYMLHAWGDLGLGTWTGVFTCGASLAVAAKSAAAVAAAGTPSAAGTPASGKSSTARPPPPAGQAAARA